MVLIGQFIGLRRRKSKKTELSREKSGWPQQNTLEIGKKTWSKDLEFKFTKMMINMKVCGNKTNDMGRELTGNT